MSQQRSTQDGVKEPHSMSLKVLRLSRPSLVAQFPVQPPLSAPWSHPWPMLASLAYKAPVASTNPEPFILSPVLNLPPSFGSAYVGETFSCILCASRDVPGSESNHSGLSDSEEGVVKTAPRTLLDVRIEAEMKTPNSSGAIKLDSDWGSGAIGIDMPVDLQADQALQRIVNFDLKEEGSHVLAVTVSYYETTDVSGRTRTFRKLYQFVCKASLIVRTKPSPLAAAASGARRWMLEAQLENCSEDTIQLERVCLDLELGLAYTDYNWGFRNSSRPVMSPGEVEQICFVVEEQLADEASLAKDERGITWLGVLGIGWRSEMGNRGFLSTGRLSTRRA